MLFGRQEFSGEWVMHNIYVEKSHILYSSHVIKTLHVRIQKILSEGSNFDVFFFS